MFGWMNPSWLSFACVEQEGECGVDLAPCWVSKFSTWTFPQLRTHSVRVQDFEFWCWGRSGSACFQDCAPTQARPISVASSSPPSTGRVLLSLSAHYLHCDDMRRMIRLSQVIRVHDGSRATLDPEFWQSFSQPSPSALRSHRAHPSFLQAARIVIQARNKLTRRVIESIQLYV